MSGKNKGDGPQRSGPIHGRNEKRFWAREVFFVPVLLAICILLYFLPLNARPLWDTDEGMHAATSKDMLLSGDWVTPQLNGEKFHDKPVLFNWLVAISLYLLGFNEVAARLPAALLGTGCVLLTYFIGRCMFRPTVGFLSGVILATSMEFIILSTVVVHDIALVFFVTLCLFFFYLGYSRERGRRTYFLLLYASAGLGVLTKGPIGALLPAMVVGLFLILNRKLSFLKEMAIGWGILVFLAIAAPWYVLVISKNPDYAGHFFIKQNLMNFLSSQEARHPRPFYYYVHLLFGGLFPWSFFLPFAIIQVFQGGFRKIDERALFVLIWFGAVFLFFSAASSKLSPYILPLFPAAALLVGTLWHELLKSPTKRLRLGFLLSAIPLPLIFIPGFFYVLIQPPIRLEFKYGINMLHVKILVLFMAVIVTAAFFLLLKRRYRSSFSALAGMAVFSILIFILLIVPHINPYRSTKGLAKQMDALLPPGEKMVFYYDLRDSALFYTDRKALVLLTPEQLRNYFASDKKAYCVLDRNYFERFEDLKQTAFILGREGRKLLISNSRPPS